MPNSLIIDPEASVDHVTNAPTYSAVNINIDENSILKKSDQIAEKLNW